MILNVDKTKLYPILEAEKSFKFNIEGVGRKISSGDQRKIIDSFSVFPFTPKIDLINPEVVFKIIEIVDDDNMIYYGREVASNRVNL